MTSKLGLATLAVLLGMSAPGWTQAPPRQPAPATTKPALPAAKTVPAPGRVVQPDNTTATYGDWVHRCQQGVGSRICEIVQTLQSNDQRGPVALVALGRPVPTEPYKFVVQLPPNVTLASGVRLALGEADEGLLAGFQRCMPGGCFAEVAMTEEAMKRWRGAVEAGQIRYQDAARREVVLQLSLRGFPAATDALFKN